jgi:hypothetical protein
MGRRLHTALVYFGLADDEELDARLREKESLATWAVAAVGIFSLLVVAALWALPQLVGIDNDLIGLAIAEGMFVLLVAIAFVFGDEETRVPPALRSPWRAWIEHLSGIVGFWSVILLVAALLGFHPNPEVLGTIGLWLVGVTLIDAVRYGWRALRRPRMS